MTAYPPFPRGPFRASDVADLGITRHDLASYVRLGLLRRVLRGVYQDVAEPDDLAARCRGAGLVLPADAVLCDRSAAWLHGVDVLAFWELDSPPPVETVVLPTRSRARRHGVRSGERDLLPSDVQTLHGVRVTTPLRTLLDLGAKLQRRHAMASIDALMAQFDISVAEVRAELPRFRGRRGVIQLRDLIELSDPAAESPGESWTRLEILDAGLPRPVSQYVVDTGVSLIRLDHAYPKVLVCVEFDGREHHSSPADRRRDEVRREWLRRNGWIVIVVRREDLLPGRRQRWLDELRTALQATQRTTFRQVGRYDVPTGKADPRRGRS